MAVVVSGVPLVGLNPAIQAAFAPAFRVADVYRGEARGRLRRRGGSSKRTAKAAGRRWDGYVDQLCRNGLAHAADTELRRYLLAQGLVPHSSQVSVYDVAARIGTRLDLVCRSPDDDRWVVFEIKLGYTHECYWRGTGPLAPPFEQWNDALAHQHQLYLGFGVDLFERTFPTRTVARDRCAVLRTTADGTLHVHALDWPGTVDRQVAWERLACVCGAHDRVARQQMRRRARRYRTNHVPLLRPDPSPWTVDLTAT